MFPSWNGTVSCFLLFLSVGSIHLKGSRNCDVISAWNELTIDMERRVSGEGKVSEVLKIHSIVIVFEGITIPNHLTQILHSYYKMSMHGCTCMSLMLLSTYKVTTYIINERSQYQT